MTAMAPEMTLAVPSHVPIPKLTTKRTLLLQGLADGKSMAEATAAARMQRESGYRAIDEMKERLPSIMDELGLDVRSILCRIREKMDATETKFIPRPEGIAERTVEAHAVQLKAIELAAKLRPELAQVAAPSIGTVNVMFAGALPDWMQGQPQPQPQPDAVAQLAATDAMPAQTGTDANLVHTDSGEGNAPPLSPLEGTGRGPGGIAHTHSGNVGGTTVPAATVPVETVPVKATLSGRIVKKRQVRLPVYKGGE